MLVCMAELGSRVTVDSRMAVDGKYNLSMPGNAKGTGCMPTTSPKQAPSNGKAQCQHACSDNSVSCSRAQGMHSTVPRQQAWTCEGWGSVSVCRAHPSGP